MIKLHDKEGQEALELLRHLQNVDTTGEKALTNFYQYLTCNAKTTGSLAGRIESTLLNYLNPRTSSCSLQKGVHLHFSSEVTKHRKLDLLAACFSLVPTLGKSHARGTRFVDFQLHLMCALCESMIAFLECHGVAHTSLSLLSNHLTQNTKSFSGLTSIQSHEMPSPEHVDLHFARIQFFTMSLRHLFELREAVDNYFCLPAIVSFFNGVFSSKLTDPKRCSNKLLTISSQLMLALSSICRASGVNLAPAGPCLLTLLIYQLEWSQNWFSETKFCDGMVRLRIAVHSGLKDLLTFIDTFSRICFLRLLPRLLQQVVSDLMRASELHVDPGDSDPSMLSEKDRYSIPVEHGMRHKILMCNLVLIERLFVHHSLKAWATTSHPRDQSVDASELSNSIQSELSRLELCIHHLVDEAIGKLSFGYKASFFNSNNDPLIHPQFLLYLAKAASSTVFISKSSGFQKKVGLYLGILIHHPDPEVSLTAIKSSQYRLPETELFSSISSVDHKTTVSVSSKICNDVTHSEINMTESHNPITDPLALNNANKRSDTSECDLVERNDISAHKAKQPRLGFDSSLNGDQHDNLTNASDTTYTPAIENLLTDFDPTFA